MFAARAQGLASSCHVRLSGPAEPPGDDSLWQALQQTASILRRTRGYFCSPRFCRSARREAESTHAFHAAADFSRAPLPQTHGATVRFPRVPHGHDTHGGTT